MVLKNFGDHRHLVNRITGEVAYPVLFFFFLCWRLLQTHQAVEGHAHASDTCWNNNGRNNMKRYQVKEFISSGHLGTPGCPSG